MSEGTLELIGGPFDGGFLPKGNRQFIMLIHYDEGKAEDACLWVYEQANGRFEFRHNGTASAQDGYGKPEASNDK